MNALETTPRDAELARETRRRRTFAIISHPDAGKTTLTEKLLLYSGLIGTAGMVKNRKGKAATSDWMGMEQERGISITSSAMQFEYKGHVINVLDTPGHQDFSEDTYRTLTAADAAIMVLDAAKGVEAQTRKLFAVCKLRGIPVLTFINKLDLPGREPLALLEEVEGALGVRASALNWPIGNGRDFCGVIDRRRREVIYFERGTVRGAQRVDFERIPLDSPRCAEVLGPERHRRALEELELIEVAGNPFSVEAFLSGQITPTFFGSALTNFGIEPFYDAFLELAPCPGPRRVLLPGGGERLLDPVTSPFSAYVFKIQANMDPRHRDCLAFIRICSGRFERQLVVKHHRQNREMRLTRPHSMVARERTTLDEAYPGDVVGLINPGSFQIGDTISADGGFEHLPLPSFQPEVFARLSPKDTGKRKAFDKGMAQLTSEGLIQWLRSGQGYQAETLAAGVGRLQFEVLQYRLLDEYGVEARVDFLPHECSAWLEGDPQTFDTPSNSMLTFDRHERPIVLFPNQWSKEYALKKNPQHKLHDFA
jgi:peptide chain release factor 3